MKKILSIVTLSAVTIMLATGCSSSTKTALSKGDDDSAIYKAEASKHALHVKSHDVERVMSAIKEGGKKEGWRMTEFKTNEIIAEKVVGDKTISTDIEFHNEYISFSEDKATSSELSGLKDAIEKTLSGGSSSH